MDISVSHLNNRLALQLPAELPLGLVFVVGQVSEIVEITDDPPAEKLPEVWFDLLEDDYRLHCVLSPRASTEVNLVEGDRIRAGGHLIFDTERAFYYLLARDVEIIETEPDVMVPVEPTTEQVGRTALTPILADIMKRSETAHIARAELPVWVQRMAPPEVQSEIEESVEADEPAAPLPDPLPESATSLNEDLVKFLSDAMEDLDEVELTPEILENISPDMETEPVSPENAAAYEVPPPAPPPVAVEPAPVQRTAAVSRRGDWIVWLLLTTALLSLVVLVILLLTN